LAHLGALFGGERGEQHDAGVDDEDVGAALARAHALGGGDQRVAVGDIGLDRDRAVAHPRASFSMRSAAGQQREPVTVGGERAQSPRRSPRMRR
jgi:hypothetical protein